MYSRRDVIAAECLDAFHSNHIATRGSENKNEIFPYTTLTE
jgi:hypothetical protein